MSPEDVRTHLELQRLNAAWCHHLDHQENDALVGLFTEDAVYVHGQRRSRGREEIRALFDSRRAQGDRVARHLQTGLLIDIVDAREARGRSVCLTFAANGEVPISPAEPYLVADFSDRYRLCDDDRWRFSSRHIERVFEAPSNSGPVAS